MPSPHRSVHSDGFALHATPERKAIFVRLRLAHLSSRWAFYWAMCGTIWDAREMVDYFESLEEPDLWFAVPCGPFPDRVEEMLKKLETGT